MSMMRILKRLWRWWKYQLHKDDWWKYGSEDDINLL